VTAPDDLTYVEDVVGQARCRAVREVLSAMLDGEVTPAAVEDVRAHLAGCPACTRWSERADRLDRLLGVGVVPDGPDLADAVLARVRLPRRGRWRAPLRIAMVVAALFQVTVGLANMFVTAGMSAAHASTHTNHEEAAFDVAFGVAMLMVAWNSRRASSEIPVLATFVALLAVTSAFDLADGQVTWTRLATHAPIVVGLVLAIALARTPQATDGPAGRAAPVPVADVSSGAVLAAVRPVAERRRRQPMPPAARRVS
jgi:predicted anti-sigma-YlaC factor YlaD